VSWSGQPDSVHLQRVQMRFDGNGISGEGPCNVYNASFTLQTGAFRVGPIASTKRGCEPQRMQLERAWFDALGKLDRLALEGSKMVLGSEAGMRLEFVRGDESPTEP
jgi:heat shock protein HslJ